MGHSYDEIHPKGKYDDEIEDLKYKINMVQKNKVYHQKEIVIADDLLGFYNKELKKYLEMNDQKEGE